MDIIGLFTFQGDLKVESLHFSKQLIMKKHYDAMVHFPDEYIPEDRTIILHGTNAVEIDGGHL